MIFIVSTGRCATTYLSGVLSQYPGVYARHEHHGRILRILQNAAHHNCTARQMGVWLLERMIRNAERCRKTHFEINLPIHPFARSLAETFPDLTFIHIVRDPRAHIRSSINWAEANRVITLLRLYAPYWSMKPSFPMNECTTRARLLERAAWNWRTANEQYAQIAQHANNYHLLHFEDFLTDSNQFICHILSIAGHKWHSKDGIFDSASSRARKNSSKGTFPPWEDWPSEYIRYVENVCGPLMRQYGYGNEPAWLKASVNS